MCESHGSKYILKYSTTHLGIVKAKGLVVNPYGIVFQRAVYRKFSIAFSDPPFENFSRPCHISDLQLGISLSLAMSLFGHQQSQLD